MNVKELKINDLGAAFFFELVFLVLTDPAAITLGFAAIIHSLSHSHSPRQFHFALPQINVKMLRGCERNSILVGTGNTQHSIDPVIHLTWVSIVGDEREFLQIFARSPSAASLRIKLCYACHRAQFAI